MNIGTSLVIIALIIAVTFLICVALIAYTMLRMGKNMDEEIKRYNKENMDRLQGGFKRGDDL